MQIVVDIFWDVALVFVRRYVYLKKSEKPVEGVQADMRDQSFQHTNQEYRP